MAMDWQAPLRQQLPEGVKDRLPREAARVRQLADAWMELFRRWGYREVVTPAFEFLDTVLAGQGALARREDYYQLFDRRGRTLALRPDMTAPIARLAATKLSGDPLPLRVAYWGPVFRHRDQQGGSLHEIWQSGIELLGAGGARADAEVVALACETLAATGLTGFKVGIGHADLVEGVLAESGAVAEVASGLRDALAVRDLVAFEKLAAGAGLPPQQADLLLSLASFHGSFDEAMASFGRLPNQQVRRALADIQAILDLLAAYGVAEQVALDLGLFRAFGYYTGVVFEGYAPGVGAPVLGGGRYDRLLADFLPEGAPPAPATGFALDVDRVLMALERQDKATAPVELDLLLVPEPGAEGEAMAQARALRSAGKAVEVELRGLTGPELAAYARARGVTRVLQVGRGQPADAGSSPERPGTPPGRRRYSGLSPIH